MTQLRSAELVPAGSSLAANAGRSAGAGATILATCFCSIDKIVLGAAGVTMLGTRFGPNLYTGVFAAGLALLGVGLGLRSSSARFPALAGVLLLGGGLVLAPPSAMHGVEPTTANLAGYGAMVLGAAALVWGFLRAFPTPKTGPAACSAGAFGAAAGCSCCVASGGIAGFAVALGFTIPDPPLADGIFYVPLMAVAAVAMYRFAGGRWALLVAAGALLAFGGDEVLKILPDAVELLPRLVVTLAGTALVVWAFGRAFSQEGGDAEPARVAALGSSDGPVAVGSGGV